MNEKKYKKISIVIAAYDEETVIEKTIFEIVRLMKNQDRYEWELICVNDGSRDNTGSLMEKAAREHDGIRVFNHYRNYGQGRALRTGFENCAGEIIVTMDADLSYGPQYIVMLADTLERENVEISLASPYAKGGTVKNVPLYRHFLSRYGNKYLAQMSHFDISTSTCVVRGYRRDALMSLFLTSDGMELQLEILMKSYMMGFRVHEIPANLEWASQKAAEADIKRVSKMKILRTIRLYLLMGWLEKPAYLFFALAGGMLLVGSYMAAANMYRILITIFQHMDMGLGNSISFSLKEVFSEYMYSIIISGGLLIFSFQMVAIALLALQNKFYFEELFKLCLDKMHGNHYKSNIE